MTARGGIPGAMAWGRRGENILMAAALLAMAVLPVLEMVLRTLWNTGIPGSSGYVQHLTLWVGFLGAMVATRDGQHLSLSTGMVSLPPLVDRLTDIVAAAISTAVAAGLAWASFRFVQAEFESPVRIGGWLPLWAAEAILPVSFAVIAVRFVARAGTWTDRACVGLGIPAAAGIGFFLEPFAGEIVLPALVGLVAAAFLGAPIFVVLGGAALVLLFAEGVPVAAIPVEAYRMIVSPTIPTIPLFTLTGYLLAEGGASRRLVRLFRALFGWLPGGLAIATAVVCAFFTTFTGASGVTILALGGLLLPVLLANGYPRRFSLGLLTATGSIGLLFPPSLAIILFGVVAHVPIPALFKAGVVPGLLMVGAVAGFGIYTALRARVPRPPFDAREAAAAGIRGIYAEGNSAARPIFEAWLKPFHDLGATHVTLNTTVGTDHKSFQQLGLPGYQFIQDPLDYDTRLHHSQLDLADHVYEEDLKQASVIMASFVYHAAMRDERMPRKPEPVPLPELDEPDE